MNENKIIISVIVPSLEHTYDMFVPVNRKVHDVIDLIKKAMFELSGGSFDTSKNYFLYNQENGNVYDMNELIRNTDIRNDTKVIML